MPVQDVNRPARNEIKKRITIKQDCFINKINTLCQH